MKKSYSKPIKTRKDALISLTDNQFGVILEDINRKFDVLVEGHGVLSQKIDGVEDRLSNEIKEVRDDLGIFKSEIGNFRKSTENNFQSAFQYLSRIDDELLSIKAEIIELKKTLTKKADIEKVTELEKRVAKIEHRLTALAR